MENITKIIFRQDTRSNWESVNPVLSVGEPGIEIDASTTPASIRLKIGDGQSSWKDLPYNATDLLVFQEKLNNISKEVETLTPEINTLSSKLTSLEGTVTGIESDVSGIEEKNSQQDSSIAENTKQIDLVSDRLNTLTNSLSADSTLANGIYILEATVIDGTVTYTWVLK